MDIDRSLPGFCREKLGVFIKTGFSFSKETLGWKSFGKVTICYFFEYRAGKVQLAVEKKSAGLSSCFLPLHWNILKKKILKSFCIFCGLFRINSSKWAGKVWPACQNCILSVYRNVFWKKNNFGKQRRFLSFSGHWAEVFGLLSTFLAGLLKLPSTCP